MTKLEQTLTLTSMDNVKAKLIELVPDIVVNPHAQLIGYDRKVTYFKECRPITLADVLRAIQKECNELYGVRPSSLDKGIAMFMFFDSRAVQCETLEGEWDLTLDYDHQTDEAKAFIGTLLGVTK